MKYFLSFTFLLLFSFSAFAGNLQHPQDSNEFQTQITITDTSGWDYLIPASEILRKHTNFVFKEIRKVALYHDCRIIKLLRVNSFRRMDVESTHPYGLNFKGTAVCPGVYTLKGLVSVDYWDRNRSSIVELDYILRDEDGRELKRASLKNDFRNKCPSM